MEKKKFEPTQADIKKWKAQYPGRDLHLITVKGKDGLEYNCILKEPDRNTMSVAGKFVNDPVQFNEVIFSNCWVDGDEEIKKDDYLKLSAEAKASTLVKFAEATIKKL